MTATCTKHSISIFGLSIRKDILGYLAASSDLVSMLVLLCLVIFLGGNQTLVSQEVDATHITASDFTVELRGLDSVDQCQGNQDLFMAELWHWIETTCTKHGEEGPKTREEDPYQDKLATMWFAKSNMGRMQLVKRMAEVMQREKMVQKAIEAYPERKYDFMEEMLTINGVKKELVAQITEWDRENINQKFVVGYAQFMSMTGLQKFLKAIQADNDIIGDLTSANEYKRYKGTKLEIRKAPEPEIILWQSLYVSSQVNRTLFVHSIAILIVIVS